MRTTLNIDDALMTAVRRRARETGESMTSIIEGALRRALFEPENVEPVAFEWHVVPGGAQPGVDITDRDALLDLMARER